MIPQEYFTIIKRYFNGDATKAFTWFATKNPSLGGVSPLDMIRVGREEKLKKFIDQSLVGIHP
jgi:hypothetical protein